MFKKGVTLFAALLMAAMAGQAVAKEKEYVLTAVKPNQLILVDMKAREVVRTYEIDSEGSSPGTIVIAPGGRIAYVVSSYKYIVGIDLITGETVFETDMTRAADERVVNMGLAISPDGKELFSYELPTRMHADRYEVLPVRLSVYPTAGGEYPTPLRVFTDLPRRINMLMMKYDGSALYGMGWDFYTIDPQTGKVVSTYPLRNWTRENASPPDILNFWPMDEQSGKFSTMVYYQRTDLPPDDMAAYPIGHLTLDLNTGEFNFDDTNLPPQVIFTGTLSPDAKTLYTVYTNLNKVNAETDELIKTVPLDHSYYQVNVSGDGTEVYVGGTMCDIGIYDAETLEKKGEVRTPDCADMGPAAFRMIDLDLGE